MPFRSAAVCALLLAVAIPPTRAQPFVQDVYPFPVADAQGVPYAHPMLGGFDVPRPQLVDIDGDGDLDLFVQEHTGQVAFFENTGTPQAYRFVWRTDRFGDLDVGEWFRFADLDGDGDLDLLAETRFSRVRYYRNDGTPGAPQFVLAADTLRTADGTPLFADAQNVPALADLTCTGLPDLFLGKVDGTLARYAHQGTSDGLPRFALADDNYQNLCIGPPDFCLSGGKQAAPQHGANAITFGDVDGDGDADLLWGDFFSPSLYFIERTGGCTEPKLERRADLFPANDPLLTGGYNAPYLADLDGDGDADLVVGVLGGAFGSNERFGGNLLLLENTGGAFVRRTDRLLPTLDVGEESLPALADLDGDGDLDLIVGSKAGPGFRTSALTFFENTGTATAPAFRQAEHLAFPLDAERFHAAPAFADLDGDGDLDLIVGGFERGIALLRNDGTPSQPHFVLVDSAFVAIPRGSHVTPALADLDGDGDLDLIAGEASGDLNYFRNDGTPQEPRFVLESEAFGGLHAGRRSAPTFVDLDGDGDFDLIVGTEDQGLVVFRNTGTPQAAAFTLDPAVTFPPQRFAAPAFADLDGDGDPDLIVGNRSGGLRYFANQRIPTHTGVPSPRTPSAVLPNYPDPFGTATTISIVLDRECRVRLVVYDLLGREVARLLDGPHPPGRHDIRFDAGTLPAGMYLYRLFVDGHLAGTGRMLRVH